MMFICKMFENISNIYSKRFYFLCFLFIYITDS